MNPAFFVFCEGKTEATYIDFLRRNFRVPVEIITRISDSNISDAYIERCKRERFTTSADKTFLMFDLDVAGMLQHLKKIRGATLILSNPCVEYWFLLHYNDVTKELSSSECITLLKKHEEDYIKGALTISLKNVLLNNVNDAIERAHNKQAYTNPSSTINLFIEEILKFKNLHTDL